MTAPHMSDPLSTVRSPAGFGEAAVHALVNEVRRLRARVATLEATHAKCRHALDQLIEQLRT